MLRRGTGWPEHWICAPRSGGRGPQRPLAPNKPAPHRTAAGSPFQADKPPLSLSFVCGHCCPVAPEGSPGGFLQTWVRACSPPRCSTSMGCCLPPLDPTVPVWLGLCPAGHSIAGTPRFSPPPGLHRALCTSPSLPLSLPPARSCSLGGCRQCSQKGGSLSGEKPRTQAGAAPGPHTPRVTCHQHQENETPHPSC